ncbi:MAG: MBL fold metallo-hydrolase [Lachnospiraceae bacterium]|nr:MBL fold metallo-hydrolase [Lachnospiraceae bacterium]
MTDKEKIFGQNLKETIKINENTWRFEDDNVRFLLLCGSEKAALIDTGMNTPSAREMAQSLTDLPLILINTHADRDHISGNSAFEEYYMSPAEEGNLRKNGAKGTILPVKEGDVIDLGDRPLRIIDIPGHTPGSIAILDEKNRVLISGDSIQDGNIFMFGIFRDLDRYIESLKHLSEYDGLYDEIYAMHGSFPVKPDLTAKLIEGAEQIRDKSVQGTKIDMFGNDVIVYKFPYAGFLCDPE